ncbi:3-oxoacyl-ACP reductase FabG [Paraburkholderia sp. LEh10]|uniref:SDR family NAD(P)-dependent oxidoreductase n=1 Tax=Paraburkholderia sp. LEh10 TaxID=2821353 RepID=UPI001AEB77AF|nr:3-oxoacyl-ACP reductase family protein [Paraburkholderia sp. LEh10]MBP0590399.1 3-oxoacyl-ACP reductase FabG [Paraburkholderia sp. LEh10]
MTIAPKTALITGAASGIGQAMASRLAREGMNIVIADINDAEETLSLVKGAGQKALYVRCDVSSEDDVSSLERQVREAFGGVDVLVNNAGIYAVQSFEDMQLSDWKRMLAINLDSVFLFSKAFCPWMKERRWGRVVNVASTTFQLSTPTAPHYVASKGGVIGFTRALATHLGPFGITVNAISPGLTRTPATEAFHDRRLADVNAVRAIPRAALPDDLAGALAFLVTDDASFITAQTIAVDGGQVRM